MQLQLQDFTTIVRTMAASVQGSARVLIDLTTGSVLRAILEANASVALWLQWLAVQVLAATRAATSSGADLDSWVADFGLARLPGRPAAATVTFSRFTPGVAAAVPVGAEVKTGDAAITFAVVADTANPAYSAQSAQYVIAAMASSVDVPVEAAVPGTSGNVGSAVISLLATAMPGIDAVTNVAPALGGMDAEPDAALRARFTNYIDSRSRATPAAIAFTIASLQQSLTHVLQENTDPSGAARPGFFTVTVDDGSGAPPDNVVSAVAAALDDVRPVGTMFAVQRPFRVLANVTLAITVAAADRDAAQAAVADAITSFVSGLAIGVALPVSRLAAIAYAAHSAVINVGSVAINGGGDLTPAPTAVIRPGTVAVD